MGRARAPGGGLHAREGERERKGRGDAVGLGHLGMVGAALAEPYVALRHGEVQHVRAENLQLCVHDGGARGREGRTERRYYYCVGARQG